MQIPLLHTESTYDEDGGKQARNKIISLDHILQLQLSAAICRYMFVLAWVMMIEFRFHHHLHMWQ